MTSKITWEKETMSSSLKQKVQTYVPKGGSYAKANQAGNMRDWAQSKLPFSCDPGTHQRTCLKVRLIRVASAFALLGSECSQSLWV